MRTDVAKLQNPEHQTKKIEDLEAMKTRKTLHPLQAAAGDKENLVGAGRMPPSGKDANKSIKKVISSPGSSKIEKKKLTIKTDKKITAEDLTSQAGPSENYWELLAERRRVALDKVLLENRQLHERIAALEVENEQCRKLLEESTNLINTLTDVFDSNQSDETLNESFMSENSDEINRSRDE